MFVSWFKENIQGAGASPLTARQARQLANRKRTIARAAVQLFFFLTMPGAFVAGFNGIKYIFRQIGSGAVIEPTSFLAALIGLGVFTILFGRFFCGYVCSFGALGDLCYWLSGLFQKKILKRNRQFSLPQEYLPYFQKLKYINLVFVIVLTAFGAAGVLQGTSAWDVFSRLTALRLPESGSLIGIMSLLAVIAGMCLQSRFFCQFLCPMGAFFAVLPILPFAPLHRDPENCLRGCSACQKMCPAGIKLEPDGFRNGECISCETCTGICPRSNIAYPAAVLFKKDIAYVAFRALVFFILGSCIGLCRFF